jgi:hypothetical protein
MSIDEVQATYQEWFELRNECFDLAKAHPDQAKAAWGNFLKAWYAAHHGIALTDRAVFKLMDDEHAELPDCPYERDSDAASIWQALLYAIDLGNAQAIRELTHKLARLKHAPHPTPQAATRNQGPATDHTPNLLGERLHRQRIMRKRPE